MPEQDTRVQIFRAEYDNEGVYFYQAFNDQIADWAIEHQTLGGDFWNPNRMTWIKPSFAWMLYRAGYGLKDENQKRILKIKIGHEALGALLTGSVMGKGNREAEKYVQVQWDPERDIARVDLDSAVLEPARVNDNFNRAIQIGLAKSASTQYTNSILGIQDVTALANEVRKAHQALLNGDSNAMHELMGKLPVERRYMPDMDGESLANIALLPGPVAERFTNELEGRQTNARKKRNDKEKGWKEEN